MCFLLTLETMNHLLTSRFVFVLSSNGGGGTRCPYSAGSLFVPQTVVAAAPVCHSRRGPSMSLASYTVNCDHSARAQFARL